MQEVVQILDNLDISVHEVPDVREVFKNTLIVVDIRLRLQEALGIFNLNPSVGTNVLGPTQREINVQGYERAQTRARERFLVVALGAIRTGWKSAVGCY